MMNLKNMSTINPHNPRSNIKALALIRELLNGSFKRLEFARQTLTRDLFAELDQKGCSDEKRVECIVLHHQYLQYKENHHWRWCWIAPISIATIYTALVKGINFLIVHHAIPQFVVFAASNFFTWGIIFFVLYQGIYQHLIAPQLAMWKIENYLSDAWSKNAEGKNWASQSLEVLCTDEEKKNLQTPNKPLKQIWTLALSRYKLRQEYATYVFVAALLAQFIIFSLAGSGLWNLSNQSVYELTLPLLGIAILAAVIYCVADIQHDYTQRKLTAFEWSSKKENLHSELYKLIRAQPASDQKEALPPPVLSLC